MKRIVVLLLCLVLLSNFASAMLGISPAVKKFDFVPNFETTIGFSILSDSNLEVELYVEGAFAEYVELSEESIEGGGYFVATLKLPAEMIVPGENRVLVGAREKILDETSFLGTSLDIRAPIYVFVPYPGKYVEAKLNIPDVNQGEDIPVEVYTINRGKNNLDVVDVDVNFYDFEGEFVKNVEFKEVSLDTHEERYFRKYVDSSDFKPGEYDVRVDISYDGEKLELNDDVRVGHLFVGVNDFTDRLSKGGIKEFNVEIESQWNGLLKNVFADVMIKDEIVNISFRTPSVDLKAWEGANLTGYIETSELEGDYDVEIDLVYEDKITSVSGTLVIYSAVKVAFMYGGIVVIALAVMVLMWLFVLRKREKTTSFLKKKPSRSSKN